MLKLHRHIFSRFRSPFVYNIRLALSKQSVCAIENSRATPYRCIYNGKQRNWDLLKLRLMVLLQNVLIHSLNNYSKSIAYIYILEHIIDYIVINTYLLTERCLTYTVIMIYHKYTYLSTYRLLQLL